MTKRGRQRNVPDYWRGKWWPFFYAWCRGIARCFDNLKTFDKSVGKAAMFEKQKYSRNLAKTGKWVVTLFQGKLKTYMRLVGITRTRAMPWMGCIHQRSPHHSFKFSCQKLRSDKLHLLRHGCTQWNEGTTTPIDNSKKKKKCQTRLFNLRLVIDLAFPFSISPEIWNSENVTPSPRSRWHRSPITWYPNFKFIIIIILDFFKILLNHKKIIIFRVCKICKIRKGRSFAEASSWTKAISPAR